LSLVTSVINCRFQLGSYTTHRTDPQLALSPERLAWLEELQRRIGDLVREAPKPKPGEHRSESTAPPPQPGYRRPG
jgi:hypothetical protein